MYNSTLSLYYAPFRLEDRYIFDGKTFLDDVCTHRKDINDFQFIRGALTQTIKVPVRSDGDDYPSSIWTRSHVNYCKIVTTQTDAEGVQSGNTYLYFITKVEQVDQGVIKFTLQLDSLNTFMWMQNGSHNLPWSEKTHISRQHKDRYTSNGAPLVDDYSEGFQLEKELFTSTLLNASDENWFMMYRTDYVDGDSSISGASNPLKVFFLGENEKKFYIPGGDGSVTITPASLDINKYYFLLEYGDKTTLSEIGVNNVVGIRIQVHVYAVGGNKLDYTVFNSNGSNSTTTIDSVTITNGKALFMTSDSSLYNALIKKDTLQKKVINAGASQVVTSLKINEIDRTDSRIVKIVKLPYPPFALTPYISGMYYVPNGFEIIDGMLSIQASKLMDMHSTFDYSLDTLVVGSLYNPINPPTDLDSAVETIRSFASPTFTRVQMIYRYEPKLHHSDFTLYKFVLDSFSYELSFEKLNITGDSQFIKVTPHLYASTSISSTYMFKIEPNYFKKSIVDYDGLIVVKRNNELPIFTNEYVNYKRNGYNFDVKANALQLTGQAISSMISLVGGIAALASTPATGGAGAVAGLSLITGAITAGTNFAMTSANQQMSMAAKMQQLQAQGSSVSGAEDLDLMEWYSPKLSLKVYTPKEYDLFNVYETLRLKGYALNFWGIPDTHTRLYYNFIQCDPDFVMSSVTREIGTNEEMFEDIKALFNSGVTFMHKPNGYNYDIEQQYENYEISLIGG